MRKKRISHLTPPRPIRICAGSGDLERPLHDGRVRVAHEAVGALLQGDLPRRGAHAADGRLLVHAGADQVEVVDVRLVLDRDRVAACLDRLRAQRDREAGPVGADELPCAGRRRRARDDRHRGAERRESKCDPSHSLVVLSNRVLPASPPACPRHVTRRAGSGSPSLIRGSTDGSPLSGLTSQASAPSRSQDERRRTHQRAPGANGNGRATKMRNKGLKILMVAIGALATFACAGVASASSSAAHAQQPSTMKLCLNLKAGTLRRLPALRPSCKAGERLIVLNTPAGKSTPGPQGPKGSDGANGANGADGQNGANGAAGGAGPQGASGTDGAAGAAGKDGAQGPQGVDGANGADGHDGGNGANGIDGAAGLSAYQLWLLEGGSGTVGDFMQSLHGTNGADGADGREGAPGLDGSNGANGANGANGRNGIDGTPGLSAYELWLSLDNSGTVGDFMQSLHGKDGAPGRDGID